jgi:signal transduction histidine kinase
MEITKRFSRTGPAIAAAVFLVCSCGFFTAKYILSEAPLRPVFDADAEVNRMLFYVNFYVPFFAAGISLYGCLFLSGFILRGICLVFSLTGVVIAGYVLNDLFTINLFMYSAYILVTTIAFKPPVNYIVSAFSILFFTLFLAHPQFLGRTAEGLIFIPPPGEILALFIYMTAFAVCAASIGFLADKYRSSETTVKHLNLVNDKLTLFNHRLQEFVKNSGEEAVKKDRLRFTRDLHDSCGYVFTNIIAVANAAMSGKIFGPARMTETLHLIKDQAQEGLNRTREVLHMIREIQDPVSASIDTIYKMKAIFEEITGIQVEVESGNMKYDYGRIVNMVLTRTVQEAFTNSVRHGQASSILLHFWEFPGQLVMTVTDNGIGAQHIVRGIGLAGMEERLASVGGTLEVFSPEKGGFRLRATIPLVSSDTAGKPAVQTSLEG